MPRPTVRLLAVALLLVAAGAAAQTAPTGSVEGRVVDAATGEALPGVTVYLNRTTLGTAAGIDGRFQIRGVPPGAYEVIASMIGYGRNQLSVVVGGTPVELSFVLREVAAPIGEALVVADTRQWRGQLRRFERLFFGSSLRARACTLVNPEVLDFAEADGAFSATASAPLVFVNQVLGYRVTVALDRFRAVRSEVAFGGSTQYEALEPESPRQSEAWVEARRVAYRGSLQHFLRAVARGTAGAEGFDGYILDGLDVSRMSFGSRAAAPPVAFDSLLVERRGGRGGAPREDVQTFAFERMLHVEYGRERADHGAPAGTSVGLSRRQHSILRLRGPQAVFRSLGYFVDPYSAETFGYWAWEGLPGDLLPLDYIPADER